VDKESNKVYSNFHNQLLFVETKISSSDLKELKDKAKICLETQDKFSKANGDLAGNIEKEFFLNESFEKILFPYSSHLANKFHNTNQEIQNRHDQSNTQKQDLNWVCTGSWINFQKKHEFNPTHHHYGDYSFVLWIQIPYNLKEELELENCKNSNSKYNSLFCFSFLDLYGRITENRLSIDKTWEGTMILFPSNLKHQVYPFFTSDDYRISISGNLVKRTSSKKTFSYQ
jgi:hypothetical protein